MTGPAIPVFQPDVKPAWSFEGPGDVGAVGGELHGLAAAFSKMQELQQAQEANQMEHMLATQALQLRQQQAANEAEQLKIRQIEARDAAKQRQHERDKEAGKVKTDQSVGQGLKDSISQDVASTVGDANVDEVPGADLMAGLFGALFGGQGAGVENEGVSAFVEDANKAGLGKPKPRDVNTPSPDAILRATVDREQMTENARRQREADAAAMERLKLQQKAALDKANGPGGGRASAMMRQKQVEYAASLVVMRPANAMLDALEKVEPSLMAGLQRASAAGGKYFMDTYIGSLQQPEQQLQMQASDQFASNWLRFVSGLAATDAERFNLIKQVAPLYGDTPEARVYKSTIRSMMVQALEGAATGEMGNSDAATVMARYNDVFEEKTMIGPNDSPKLREAKTKMRVMWRKSQEYAAQKVRLKTPATSEIAVPENVDPDAAAAAGGNWVAE